MYFAYFSLTWRDRIYTVDKHVMLALLSISRVALMFSKSIAYASLERQIVLQYNQKN